MLSIVESQAQPSQSLREVVAHTDHNPLPQNTEIASSLMNMATVEEAARVDSTTMHVLKDLYSLIDTMMDSQNSGTVLDAVSYDSLYPDPYGMVIDEDGSIMDQHVLSESTTQPDPQCSNLFLNLIVESTETFSGNSKDEVAGKHNQNLPLAMVDAHPEMNYQIRQETHELFSHDRTIVTVQSTSCEKTNREASISILASGTVLPSDPISNDYCGSESFINELDLSHSASLAIHKEEQATTNKESLASAEQLSYSKEPQQQKQQQEQPVPATIYPQLESEQITLTMVTIHNNNTEMTVDESSTQISTGMMEHQEQLEQQRAPTIIVRTSVDYTSSDEDSKKKKKISTSIRLVRRKIVEFFEEHTWIAGPVVLHHSTNHHRSNE